MQGRFDAQLIRKLLSRRGLANERTTDQQLGLNEWWLDELARKIPVSPEKLGDWTRNRWVTSWKTSIQGLWVL